MKVGKKIISIIGILLLLLGDILIIHSAQTTGFVPEQYFIVLVGVLIAVNAVIAFPLFFMNKSEGIVGEVIGLLISCVLVGLGVFSLYMTTKLNDTLEVITSPEDVADVDYTKTKVMTYKVYVRADDSANRLSDAADYTFAFSSGDTKAVVKKCRDAIKEAADIDIKILNKDSVFDMVDSLYSGEADAIVMNSVYDEALNESDSYAGFQNLTNDIYEFSVTAKADTEPNTSFSFYTNDEEQAAENDEADDPEEIIKKPFVMYLSGSDSRRKKLSYGRSDVNLLLAVNPVTNQILMVNTPRDYYVKNPAGKGDMDKLAHCGNYGINCSIKAMSQLYDIDIPYYARVNFSGFETLIDALGGIDVESDTAFVAQEADYQIEKGMNHLNGYQALAFVRERHALENGDYDRGQNQMKVLSAMIHQVSLGTILLNYSEILESVSDMFFTNVTRDEISALVKNQLTNRTAWKIQSVSVTGEGGKDTTYSIPDMDVYVVYPEDDSVAHASELIHKIMDGETLSEADLVMPD